MELLFLLVAVLSLWILLKLLAWTFKVGFVLLILPLKILLVLLLAVLAVFVVLPVALAFGALTIALTPLVLLGPFLPVLLIAIGIWLLLRRA